MTVPILFAGLSLVYLLAGAFIRCDRYGWWVTYTVDNTSRCGIYVQPYLNGLPVDKCVYANVLLGFVDSYVLINGEMQLDHDRQRVLERRQWGRVEVRVIEDCRREVSP